MAKGMVKRAGAALGLVARGAGGWGVGSRFHTDAFSCPIRGVNLPAELSRPTVQLPVSEEGDSRLLSCVWLGMERLRCLVWVVVNHSLALYIPPFRCLIRWALMATSS